MRSATVVLPVPGLPVKLMCRLGACAAGALPGMEYNGEPTSGHLAGRRQGAQLVAHRLDHGLIVGAAEYGAAGDEGIGARGRRARDVADLDAAVDLEADVAAARPRG